MIAFSDHGGGVKYIQNEQFFNLTNKYNVLFVRDISRSWFNNIDTKLIKKNIKNKTCYAIGNSMGAFNAIIFSNLHNIKKVIAFSPQFSIHPKISRDKDFINHAARIRKWKYPQLIFSKRTKKRARTPRGESGSPSYAGHDDRNTGHCDGDDDNGGDCAKSYVNYNNGLNVYSQNTDYYATCARYNRVN